MVLAEVAPWLMVRDQFSSFFLNLVNVRIMVGNRSGRRVQLLLDRSYFTGDAVFVSLTPPPHPTQHRSAHTYTVEPFHFSWFVDFSHLIAGAPGP